jgi:hypothetical protein
MNESKEQSKGMSMLAAIDESMMECEGDWCDHSSFVIGVRGSNSITRLCPFCNAKLKESLKGSSAEGI